ncbi:MAG TPA: DUF4340 domain-containing protein, partial [bacterium]
GKAHKEKRETKAKKLLAFDASGIRKLAVKRASDSFVLEKNAAQDWRLLSPVDDRADKSTSESFASTLAALNSEGEIPDATRLSDYGLEIPLQTVIVSDQSGKSDTLYFGDKNPTENFVYVRRPRESRVILANNSVQTYLTKSVFDLRDKSVLPFENDAVEQIRIESRGRALFLTRTESVWNLVEPVKTRADENTVDGFLNQFRWAQVKEYVDEAPRSLDRYGLSRPAMCLTLTLGPNKSQKILFIGRAKEKDRYYAKDKARQPVFLVDSTLVREFRKSVFDFLDKKIARFEPDSVKGVRIEYKDRPPLSCRLDTAKQWHMDSPRKAKALDYKINGILYDVRDMLVRDYVGERSAGLKAFGLDKPQAKVVFTDHRGGTLVEIWIGRRAGGKLVYVMNPKTKWVYKADELFINNLRPDTDDLVEKQAVKPDSLKTDSFKAALPKPTGRPKARIKAKSST